MIQRFISNATMERFMKAFKQKCDSLKKNGHTAYIPPEDAARIVDAINLWEQMRYDQFYFTFADLARLNPTFRSIPTSQVWKNEPTASQG